MHSSEGGRRAVGIELHAEGTALLELEELHPGRRLPTDAHAIQARRGVEGAPVLADDMAGLVEGKHEPMNALDAVDPHHVKPLRVGVAPRDLHLTVVVVEPAEVASA